MTRSVSRHATFSALASDGRRINDGSIRLTHLGPDHPAVEPGDEPGVAFAISRRFGTAVDRNRARRRLRHAFDEAWTSSTSPPPGVFLVGARPAVLEQPFPELVSAFRRCFDRLGDDG